MISPADIEKLAVLARVDVPKEELEDLAKDAESIIAYVARVEKKVKSGVERPSEKSAPAPEGGLKNVMREDGEPTPSSTWTEKLLSLAPKRSGDYISVKNVFE
ncbi:MAG: Asp-tRNA(Asn)/Glu-tRNA(Gln) amidotransferase subunit GatC [Patescibacteria group bacterium]